MKNIYFVVLAGGSGDRLWPLSNKEHPKQLIPFLSNKSLLEQTLDRISSLVSNKNNVIIVTHKDYQQSINTLVGHRVGMIIIEEVARNTAPAILLACEYIRKRDNHALVVVLPSDAYIPDSNAFCSTLSDGVMYLEKENCNDIVMFGLKPNRAATGYGYIQSDCNKPVDGGGYRVLCFHEKPDEVRAQIYAKQSDMWWNIGIFAASVQTFLQEFLWHAPDVVAGVSRYLGGESSYEDVPNISIDYAVIEKSLHVVVFPALFDWFDVGNLNVFLTLQDRYSQHVVSVMSFDGAGNLASTQKKFVVCIGVSDLCIVETGDVLLITQKKSAENVKQVLPFVKKRAPSIF